MSPKAAKAKEQKNSPSRLHAELAGKIVERLKEEKAGVGQHLVELELCDYFAVSRTPIRGALKLLAAQGLLESRANRGFVLAKPVEGFGAIAPTAVRDEEEKLLFVKIAEDRLSGRLEDECTQQELVRRYNVRVAVVVTVLRQLADLGVVERKPGNGWMFLPTMDSSLAQEESYQLRIVLEPAILRQEKFELDLKWARETRKRHEYFRNEPWRDTMAVEFYEVNADFHEKLALASNNRYMLHIMQQQNSLRRFMNYSWQYGVERVQASIDEHLAILSALEKSENEVAAVLMRRHLEDASQTYFAPNEQHELDVGT
ncbi:MAG: GntR family transcriptional regulator [Rhizobiales bacterium]|nr:GntR family transcriptional regulator [Hyphomicrobiales bacterium]